MSTIAEEERENKGEKDKNDKYAKKESRIVFADEKN